MICPYKQGPAVVTGRSPLVLVLLGGDESGSGLAAGQLERRLLVWHRPHNLSILMMMIWISFIVSFVGAGSI